MVAPIGLLHLWRVDGGNHRVDVNPREAGERRGDALVLVQQQRRREPGELQRAERGPLGARRLQARRDDGPARAPGADHPRARRGRERHPEAAEPARVSLGRAQGRVPAVDVLLRVLRQPDHHEPPVELGSVPPLEHA